MQSDPAPAVDPNFPEELEVISTPPEKPGWKTSEFIGKCVLQLIGLGVLFGWVPLADQPHASELAIGLIALLESIYILGRSWLKGNARTVFTLLGALCMLSLSACTPTGGLALGPLKARVCYVNAEGQRVCLKSEGSGVEIEGDITGSRSLGDGKTVIEFRTGN